MTELADLLEDLVVANRILATENVVDAYGHISVRHPERPNHFLLSRSLAPALVDRADIIEFDSLGEAVNDGRPAYVERYIHAAVYAARPDVSSIVHAHSEETLPFGLVSSPLRSVFHVANAIGTSVPVWDIRTNFGDTNMLVSNLAQGTDLARALDAGNVVLMRGHGFTAVARSVIEAVRVSVYLPRNARVQMDAMRLGEIVPLSEGELRIRNERQRPDSPEVWRAWEYWAERAGCRDRVRPPSGS